jgi:hypothetical protein
MKKIVAVIALLLVAPVSPATRNYGNSNTGRSRASTTSMEVRWENRPRQSGVAETLRIRSRDRSLRRCSKPWDRTSRMSAARRAARGFVNELKSSAYFIRKTGIAVVSVSTLLQVEASRGRNAEAICHTGNVLLGAHGCGYRLRRLDRHARGLLGTVHTLRGSP